MASNESWIDRQQRMVRCRRHGLHYDPKLASGCYLCLKEAAKRRKPAAPKFLLLLGLILGMAVVLYRFFGPELGLREEAIVGLEIEESAPGRILDAEDYRGEIQAFEQALFQAPATTRNELASTSGRIGSTARILSERLDERDGDSVAAASMADLAGSLPGQLSFTRLEKTREEWLRLRRRHLGSAPWFVEPSGAAAASSSSAEKRAAVAEYRDIASELTILLQDGNAQALALVSSPDQEAWRAFMDDWRERLREIAARKPKRPRAGASSEVLLGFERLERAFSQARSLANGNSAPQQASGAFQRAYEQAEEAVRAFDGAG